MRSACRNLCIAWLCGAGLLGIAFAQQKQPADAAAQQADAAKKVDAAKAAATDIERLETARAALAAQRNALANAAKENAARAQLDQKQAAAADQQRKTAVAEAAAQVQKIITQLHAAEAAGGQGNEKTIADLQKQRADALAAYRALLAAVPAIARRFRRRWSPRNRNRLSTCKWSAMPTMRSCVKCSIDCGRF